MLRFLSQISELPFLDQNFHFPPKISYNLWWPVTSDRSTRLLIL